MKNYVKYKLKKLKFLRRQFEQTLLLKVCIGFILGCILFDKLALTLALIISCFVIFNFKKILIFLIFLIIGIVYTNSWITAQNNQMKTLIDKNVEYDALVSEEPDYRGFTGEIIVDTGSLKGYVLIKIPRNSTIAYGDELKISGVLSELEDNSFKDYLTSKKVFYELKKPKVTPVNQTNPLLYLASSIKKAIVKVINDNISRANSELLQGILLGNKNEISKDIKDDLTAAGLSHIITISGYNFTIIFIYLLSFSSLINRKTILVLSIPILFLFLLVVGITNVTALRAMFMLLFIIIAQIIGRKYNTYLILSLVLSLILIEYPLYWSNISLQLGLLALIGVFILADQFKKLFVKFPEFISESLSLSLGVTLATMPLVILIFGQFSLISFISNLIILPFIPLILLSSSLALLFYVFKLAIIYKSIFFLLDKILGFILMIINHLANLPFSSTSDKGVMVVIFLSLFGLLIYLDYKAFKKRISS